MRSFLIFTGKECTEHIRSKRLLILGLVFILFGIMSPAAAKFMPEILKMAGNDTGVIIQMSPPTVLDSYLQFFKNMNSIAVIVLLLVFAGLVVDEKAKGTASILLTKSLSRPAFLLAKFTAAAVLWTAIYAVSAFICQGYTLWLFPSESARHLLISFAAYWLYGLLLLALTIFASTAAKSHGLATLGAFAAWGLLMLSMIPKKAAAISPASLGAINLQVIAGTMPTSDLLVPAIAAIALIALVLGCASWAITRQEL